MRWGLVVVSLVATAGVVGVLAHDTRGIEDHAVSIDPAPIAPTVRSLREPSASPRPASSCKAGVRALSAGGGGVAVVVTRPTVARRSPGGVRIARFARTNVNGVQTVFGVLGARVRRDCEVDWYRVQLPLRPNGITGWVRADDVRRFSVRTRVVVDLSDRRVTVYRGRAVALEVRAAIGKPETPTPTGRYYVNQRLLAGDPLGPWGPGGVGISAFSPVLVDWVQGGPIAIHGTNQPRSIGEAVSNGCVRISNYHLLELMRLAPEGTPVEIRA